MEDVNTAMSYERLLEIAIQLKDGLLADGEYEALAYMKDIVKLTKEESVLFNVKLY